MHRRKRTAAAACCLFLWLPAFAGLEVLHAFRKPGTAPVGQVLRLPGGESYATCSSGGAHDHGAVIRITAAGAVETVASFEGANGSAPAAGLTIGPDGAFYGTTSGGGAGGFGTAFKVVADGTLTKLTDFTGTSGVAKGSVPGPLVLDGDGQLYGTTAGGGAGGFGTLFKMTAAGAVTTLAEFTGTAGAAKGGEPRGALVLDGDAIYGVSRTGGAANLGTVFRLQGGVLSTLVEFTGANGSRPAGGLLLHADGQLYGTTEFGGAEGFGTAFRLTTTANPAFTSLRSFSDLEGSQPAGELIAADAVTLLGCVATGSGAGWGGVYALTTSGAFTMLASFTGEGGSVPGAAPRAGLAAGSDGLFHGITSAGGPGQLGSVFTISPAGAFTTTAHLSPAEGWMPSGAPVSDGTGGWLFPLAAGGDGGGGTLAKWSGSGLTTVSALGGTLGSAPDGALTAKDGAFFGIASQGAASGRGSVFRYDPAGGTTLVNAFTSTGGALADGGLIDGSDGALYGAGREGGSGARGTLFKVTTAGVRTRIVSFTGIGGAFPGSAPRGPLVLAYNQGYYGVTARGGSADSGVLFKLSSLGTYTPLAHFAATGPRLPAGGLTAAADGMIYGTCSSGGTAGAGAILQVNPDEDTWSVAASFDGTTAGTPAGELHALPDGSLAGLSTAPAGIFRYSPSAGLQSLATFDGITATADDGAGLVFSGGLATAADGTIYGTASGGGPQGGGVLFRITPDSPLAAWKAAHLGSPDAPDDGDPDQDGLPNVVEYALGSSPVLAGPPPAPVIDGGRLALPVSRDPARNDVVQLVEASSDLASWTPLAASVNGSAFTGASGISGETSDAAVKSVLVRDIVPVAAAPRRFLRLRVLSGFTPATPIEAWKMTWLGDPQAPDEADPDLDGHANLLEYALSSVPTVPDAAALPAVLSGGYLTLTFPRDPAKSDLTLTVEATSDLAGPWTPVAVSTLGSAFTGAGYLSGETPGPALKSVLVRDTVAMAVAPHHFLRLRVTR